MVVEKKIEAFYRFFQAHGYHLFFAVNLISLIALVGWWSVFINAAIEQEPISKRDALLTEARVHALSLGHKQGELPPVASLDDERFEIAACANVDEAKFYSMRPYWPNHCVRPTAKTIADLERKLERRRLMIFGESALLLLLVFISIFMLYRLVKVERNFAREMSEFWSRVTHEFKTPITGIKAFLQTLKSGKLNHEELEPIVDMALKQIDRQERLAENILIGHRLNKGGMGLSLRAVNLPEYIERLVEGHKLLLSDIKIEERNFQDPLEVVADSDALHVIFDNILNNALKYCGEKASLTVSLSSKEETALVTISDNGPGFEPKDAEHLFAPYRRLSSEAAGSHQGTGLGLYISRKLAEKMGGSLTAKSEGKGKGASFILTLKKRRA